jgi:hypothetical protein
LEKLQLLLNIVKKFLKEIKLENKKVNSEIWDRTREI